ncbi:hypothetical protein DIPPA_00215 [Diplonema papillatum]|nr:hypothetical protein DIPPA_00215 [Diplonema papillatum]
MFDIFEIAKREDWESVPALRSLSSPQFVAAYQVQTICTSAQDPLHALYRIEGATYARLETLHSLKGLLKKTTDPHYLWLYCSWSSRAEIARCHGMYIKSHLAFNDYPVWAKASDGNPGSCRFMYRTAAGPWAVAGSLSDCELNCGLLFSVQKLWAAGAKAWGDAPHRAAGWREFDGGGDADYRVEVDEVQYDGFMLGEHVRVAGTQQAGVIRGAALWQRPSHAHLPRIGRASMPSTTHSAPHDSSGAGSGSYFTSSTAATADPSVVVVIKTEHGAPRVLVSTSDLDFALGPEVGVWSDAAKAWTVGRVVNTSRNGALVKVRVAGEGDGCWHDKTSRGLQFSVRAFTIGDRVRFNDR